MAIVTFWSECKKEVGQTATAIAVATQMAVEHNYKILLVSTYNRNELQQAFWLKEKTSLAHLFDGGKKSNVDSGVQGLSKTAKSNRITPEMIINYTRIIFKNRLEVLDGYGGGEKEEYNDIFNTYPQIILNAANYFDYVIVDLNKELNNEITEQIIEKSDIIAYGINQKNSTLETYMKSRDNGFIKSKNNIITYLGRYDRYSKYNVKNISRFLKLKKDLNCLSYNTLFNDACDEGTVSELFLKLNTLKSDNKNIEFMNDIRRISESIEYKLKELQLKV